jgi:hypothetical protein
MKMSPPHPRNDETLSAPGFLKRSERVEYTGKAAVARPDISTELSFTWRVVQHASRIAV